MCQLMSEHLQLVSGGDLRQQDGFKVPLDGSNEQPEMWSPGTPPINEETCLY